MRQYWTPPFDDDIPLPPVDHGRRGQPKSALRLNLRSLQVDQSVFVPLSVASRYRIDGIVRATTYRHGIKFAVRSWTEKGVEGTRVWRI